MFNLEIYKKYIKELFTLALPMIVGNLSIILIGFGDVFVAARYSTSALAAVSIANSLMSVVFMFGFGILSSVSPVLSNYRGKKIRSKRYLFSTVKFAMLLSAISTAIILMSLNIVGKLGLEANLLPQIKDFMFIISFSTFGVFLQMSLKEFLQAFEIVVFPNLLNFAGVFLNIALCFIFTFGLLGFPELGVLGLGLASLLVRSLSGFLMLIYCMGFVKSKQSRDTKYYKALVKVGLPIAMAIVIESLAFNAITIIVARESSLYAAAQNILLTLVTATFMVPMAISNAIAVKTGYSNGAKNYNDLQRYSFSGISISAVFMAVCASFFILMPEFFIKIFTTDKNLLQICIPALMLGGIFQIFDGLQVSLGGVFKGLKETKIVLAGNILAYWIFGIPLGWFLAFKLNLGLMGFWIGLAIAILILSILLFAILLSQFREMRKKDAR